LCAFAYRVSIYFSSFERGLCPWCPSLDESLSTLRRLILRAFIFSKFGTFKYYGLAKISYPLVVCVLLQGYILKISFNCFYIWYVLCNYKNVFFWNCSSCSVMFLSAAIHFVLLLLLTHYILKPKFICILVYMWDGNADIMTLKTNFLGRTFIRTISLKIYICS